MEDQFPRDTIIGRQGGGRLLSSGTGILFQIVECLIGSDLLDWIL